MGSTNLIGDIHGHAEELKQLLVKLGYSKSNGTYVPSDPNETTCFVGDYIDRGTEIPEVLDIVRRMVDSGRAIALMGNHEYNAICYNTKNEDGELLRAHTPKNTKQHKATLEQFAGRKNQYQEYINWFKTLPLFHESPAYRAVHACWDQGIIKKLQPQLEENRLTDDVLLESAIEGTDLFEQIEITLKGKELPLPEGISFNDKDGHPRQNVRIKWWISATGKTYQDIRMNLEYDVPNVTVDPNHELFSSVYPIDAKPVFFGHYWLRDTPNLHQGNICCLDYSVAKGGILAGYQFDGEDILLKDKFCF